MNKNDKILILLILVISFTTLILSLLFRQEGSKAIVYHGNTIIQTIDLKIDHIYQVQGDLGKIDIEVKNKKIRVIEENSPYHLCSKQGFISSSNETIICMPNRIRIEILGENTIDTQVK